MSEQSQGPGWWLASDGKWYPPQTPEVTPPPAAPAEVPPPPPGAPPAAAEAALPPSASPAAAEAAPTAPPSAASPGPGYWLASDGNWYPPESSAETTAADQGAAAPAPATATGTAPPGVPPLGTKGVSIKKPLLIMGAAIFAVLVLVAGVLVVQQFRGRIADNGVPLGVDEVPSSDLALADGAVVVRSDNGNAVKEISPDGKRLVLDANASGLDQLQPGNVMILTGITAVTADKVERNGDRVTITAKPARLTDIIKDGKIHFEQTEADLGKATLRVFAPTPDLVTTERLRFAPNPAVPTGGLTAAGLTTALAPGADAATDPSTDATATATATPRIDGPATDGWAPDDGTDQSRDLAPAEVQRLFAGGEGESAAGFVDLPLTNATENAAAGGATENAQTAVSRQGELGGFHYEFDARVTGDSITFTLRLTRDENGFRIDINVSADVAGVGFNGDIEISAATVRQFRLDTPNLRGKATITASAAAGPQATRLPVTIMHLPMSVQIPFPIYGIPFTVGIEADAKVELVFTSRDAYVSGSFDAHFGGSGGMGVNNGSLTASGAFNQDWTDPLEAVEGVAITPTSLIVTIQFPKVSLGVGIALARASAFIEAVYAFAPTVSGATNITPCRAEPVSMTVKAGIVAEFLGHEIGSHEVVISQRSAAPFDPPTRVCQI